MAPKFPPLQHLLVRSLDVDSLRVFWAFLDDADAVYDLLFQIERSESSEGPWVAIGVPFQNRFSFVDTTIPVGNKFRQIFYRLVAKHLPSGAEQVYGPASQEAPPDLIALELQRHFMMLYKEFSGRPCWLFPVRTFGARCPQCWDRKTQNRIKSRCATCYNTSYLHGFLSPIEIHIDISPNANGQQPSTLGKQQQQNTTADMGWYPKVKPDDVIVEPENVRWRVVSQVQTEQNRAIVSQQLQLHQIERTDIEMALPLDSSLLERNLWLGPKRNFSNPHNQQNRPEDLLEVFPHARKGARL